MKGYKHLLLFSALTFLIFGSDLMAQRTGRTQSTRSSRDATTYQDRPVRTRTPDGRYNPAQNQRPRQYQQPRQQPQRQHHAQQNRGHHQQNWTYWGPRNNQTRYYERYYAPHPNSFYSYSVYDHIYHCEPYRVYVLPNRARPLFYNGRTIYFARGMFYRPMRRGFMIMEPPIGLYMDFLPRRAEEIWVYNRRFYEFNGVWYKEARHRPGFIVVEGPW